MNCNAYSKKRPCILFILGIFLLLIIFTLSICLGSIPISLEDMKNAFTENDKIAHSHYIIITTIRLPRVLAALIGGASIAVSGLMMQIFFQNPIVEPYILGISSGANLFVGLVILGGFTFGMTSMSKTGMLIGSFLGAMFIMIMVIFASQKVKSVTTLLIIGLMLGYVCSAATSVLTALADREKIASFTLWTMGSFSGFKWSDVRYAYIITIPFLIIAFLMSKPLNAMLLGEKYARSMGVSIKLFRFLIVIVSSILTAVITAFAGPISFIGLAVPHIVRMTFKTNNNRIMIPAVCIYGAVMTGFCDLIARLIIAPTELPLNAVTSIIGAPIVVYLLVRKKGGTL